MAFVLPDGDWPQDVEEGAFAGDPAGLEAAWVEVYAQRFLRHFAQGAGQLADEFMTYERFQAVASRCTQLLKERHDTRRTDVIGTLTAVLARSSRQEQVIFSDSEQQAASDLRAVVGFVEINKPVVLDAAQLAKVQTRLAELQARV